MSAVTIPVLLGGDDDRQIGHITLTEDTLKVKLEIGTTVKPDDLEAMFPGFLFNPSMAMHGEAHEYVLEAEVTAYFVTDPE